MDGNRNAVFGWDRIIAANGNNRWYNAEETMSKKRETFVANKIEGMSLEEKVGQCLTFTWRGTMLTPSGIEQITRLQCGGLCLEPGRQLGCLGRRARRQQPGQTVRPAWRPDVPLVRRQHVLGPLAPPLLVRAPDPRRLGRVLFGREETLQRQWRSRS